jgi:anti-sigma regulatory factor (Ser/Thr protein kinase)
MEKMISSLQTQEVFAIAHNSDVSAARRYATQLASSLDFTETQSGRLAIIITELATNIVKHAREGMLFITSRQHENGQSIQILSLDKGPGIANLVQSMHDGVSTAGTAGNGLGAIKRLSNEFDVYSSFAKGSAFYASIYAKDNADKHHAPLSVHHNKRPMMQYGTICVPVAGEEECGDAWAVAENEDGITFLLADGLGHGPDAATASRTAVHTLESQGSQTPTILINAMHQAMRITRGAALAIGQLRFSSASLHFAGVGNIAACLIEGETRKQLVSHNGTVGHNMRKVQEFTVTWPEDAIYVMCSDGINTQWDLSQYPGIASCHPALIAGVIYRDFTRGRDDAAVVVARKSLAF